MSSRYLLLVQRGYIVGAQLEQHVQKWYTVGTELQNNWYTIGTTLVRSWYEFGAMLVPGWYQVGNKSVPTWYQVGTKGGINTVQTWY